MGEGGGGVGAVGRPGLACPEAVETRQTRKPFNGDRWGSSSAISGADSASGPRALGGSTLCSMTSSLIGARVVIGVYDVAS